VPVTRWHEAPATRCLAAALRRVADESGTFPGALAGAVVGSLPPAPARGSFQLGAVLVVIRVGAPAFASGLPITTAPFRGPGWGDCRQFASCPNQGAFFSSVQCWPFTHIGTRRPGGTLFGGGVAPGCQGAGTVSGPWPGGFVGACLTLQRLPLGQGWFLSVGVRCCRDRHWGARHSRRVYRSRQPAPFRGPWPGWLRALFLLLTAPCPAWALALFSVTPCEGRRRWTWRRCSEHLAGAFLRGFSLRPGFFPASCYRNVTLSCYG
jgi:hypothetical protein